MFDFFKTARTKRLSYDQLQTMQMVAQQVVLSLEGSVRIPGATKKALALSLMGELLQGLGIVAPESLVDTSIEASVRLMKALDAQAPEPPRAETLRSATIPSRQDPLAVPKLDVSGRPSTGNSEKGLST